MSRWLKWVKLIWSHNFLFNPYENRHRADYSLYPIHERLKYYGCSDIVFWKGNVNELTPLSMVTGLRNPRTYFDTSLQLIIKANTIIEAVNYFLNSMSITTKGNTSYNTFFKHIYQSKNIKIAYANHSRKTYIYTYPS